jgi:hypothetical protein
MKRLIARAGLLTIYPLRVFEHATRPGCRRSD